jgi:hypothetical protein
MGHHVSGEISSAAQGPLSLVKSADLETLRQVAEFIIDKRCVGLLGTQINFSTALAQLLLMHHKKTLIIDTRFDKVVPTEDVPGLWHYLTGHTLTLPIRTRDAIAYVPAGGMTSFAAELLAEGKFSELLHSLRENYDHIFLIGSDYLLPFLDAAIVTLNDESVRSLEKIRTWSRQKSSLSVTFMQLETREVT